MGMIATFEKDYDNRSIIHSTPRYRGTTTCFTSQDDDQADPSKVWGGSNEIKIYHNGTGDAMTQSLYLDFNTIDNLTYILAGHVNWKGAVQDYFSCSIVPTVTVYSADVNTNYNLFGGYLIIPAAGDGTIDVQSADIKLIQVPSNEYGDPEGAGYWNADYNTATKQFENITASLDGTGNFNMFGVEVELSRYVNRYMMIGDGRITLTAYDAAQLGHGMRLKFDVGTATPDHEWWFDGALTMFRKKTV